MTANAPTVTAALASTTGEHDRDHTRLIISRYANCIPRGDPQSPSPSSLLREWDVCHSRISIQPAGRRAVGRQLPPRTAPSSPSCGTGGPSLRLPPCRWRCPVASAGPCRPAVGPIWSRSRARRSVTTTRSAIRRITTHPTWERRSAGRRPASTTTAGTGSRSCPTRSSAASPRAASPVLSPVSMVECLTKYAALTGDPDALELLRRDRPLAAAAGNRLHGLVAPAERLAARVRGGRFPASPATPCTCRTTGSWSERRACAGRRCR